MAAAFLLGHVATVVLFGLISFWALREFITLTPTRPGDHRTLFWVFFLFTPLQFVLVGTGYYGLYSIVIPVYAFLFIPAAHRLGRRLQAVPGADGEDSGRAADLRLLPELRPGAADAAANAAEPPRADVADETAAADDDVGRGEPMPTSQRQPAGEQRRARTPAAARGCCSSSC